MNRYSRVCGCPIAGQMMISPLRDLLIITKKIGSCPNHSAEVLIQRMTRSLQRFSRTGLWGGKLRLQEGGSIGVEEGYIVARVPLMKAV